MTVVWHGHKLRRNLKALVAVGATVHLMGNNCRTLQASGRWHVHNVTADSEFEVCRKCLTALYVLVSYCACEGSHWASESRCGQRVCPSCPNAEAG